MPKIVDRVSEDKIEEMRRIRMAKGYQPDIEVGMNLDDMHAQQFGVDLSGSFTDDLDEDESLQRYKDNRDVMVNQMHSRYGVGALADDEKEEEKTAEDYLFEYSGKAARGTLGWFARVFNTLSEYSISQRSACFLLAMKLSSIFFVIGGVFLFTSRAWLPWIVVGCLNLGLSSMLFFFTISKLQTEVETIDLYSDTESNEDNEIELSVEDTEDLGSDYDLDGVLNTTAAEDLVDESVIVIEDSMLNFDVVEPIPEPVRISTDVGSMDEIDIDRGMVTRQYLYEKMINILPDITPGYYKSSVLDSTSMVFNAWASLIYESAKVLNPKVFTGENESPELLYAEEQFLYTRLDVSRVSWLKDPQKLVEELVSRYSYDERTNKREAGVYGWAETVGDKVYIRIMNGKPIKVGLRDMSTTPDMREYILNPKVSMPVLLGVDAQGDPVNFDFIDAHSLLVTGVPRTGKSWFVKSLLYQLLAYNTPEQLHLYFGDAKDATSDFRGVASPHVKQFASGSVAVITMLKRLLEIEAPKNEKIIGEAGCLNIADYNKIHIGNPLAYKIVLVDEIIALVESMDKEQRTEFQEILLALVTKTPSFGIRIMLIPHKLNDNILKKTITDMMPFRGNVKGNITGITNACGDEAKSFKQQLTQVGDMAIKATCISDRPGVFYCHSVILSESNAINSRVFETQARLWAKLYPDEVKGSRYNAVYGE